MKAKSDTKIQLLNFVAFVKTQFNFNIKAIRSDNGPEFALHDFYATNGVQHQLSCVETPQQNGVVERKHQHILNVARALLFQSKIPVVFWSFAVSHAVHLINILQINIIRILLI